MNVCTETRNFFDEHHRLRDDASAGEKSNRSILTSIEINDNKKYKIIRSLRSQYTCVARENGKTESPFQHNLAYFFLLAFSAALVTLPLPPTAASTDLMTPTATV